MRTSAAGSNTAMIGVPAGRGLPHRGFTLLELLVVVAVMATATAAVTLSVPDRAQATLERDAQRLAVLLESARAQSRANGVAVRWHSRAEGFYFEGLPAQALPNRWLDGNTVARAGSSLLLGPEPLIGPQAVELASLSQPGRSLRVATDGLRPFVVQHSGQP